MKRTAGKAIIALLLCLFLAETARANEKVYRSTLASTVWVLTPRGSGSGFVVDREKKLVVTNYHVICGYYQVNVMFPVREKGELKVARDFYRANYKNLAIKARVVSSDPRRDLALLQLDRLPAGVPAMKLAAKNAQPGQNVHSVGNPGASHALWNYRSGTVRQVYLKTMRMRTGFTVVAKVVETQSPINPGDSGGPVVNDSGELVAVSQGYRSGSRLLSVSIAVSELKELLQGRNKTMDPRVQKFVDELKVPFTVTLAGVVRVIYPEKNGRSRSIYVSNRTQRFGGMELREFSTTVWTLPSVVPEDIANLLLYLSSRTPLGGWQVRKRGSQTYVIYAAKIAADANANTVKMLFDGMTMVSRDMTARIGKLEADRRARKKQLAGPTVVGRWSVKKQTTGGQQPNIELELRSDKTFWYRIGDFVSLKGTYSFINGRLTLAVGNNTLIKGAVTWAADGSFLLIEQSMKYTFQKRPAAKLLARRGK